MLGGENHRAEVPSKDSKDAIEFDLSESIFTDEQKEICQKLLQSHRDAFVVQGNLGVTDKVIKEQISKGIIEPASDGSLGHSPEMSSTPKNPKISIRTYFLPFFFII